MLISSFFVLISFYIAPHLINYGENEFFTKKEFENNSKKILAYTLNKKNGNDKTLDEKDLLFDIFSLNDLETDTVRLNASTIKQLI